MAEISDEETPIYTQLQQEYAARDKFAEIFGPEAKEMANSLNMATYALRQGGITVYGNPIVPRDA